jgi:signal transduction histidine kinase
LANSILILLLDRSLDLASQLLETSKLHSSVINTLCGDLYVVTRLLINGGNVVMSGDAPIHAVSPIVEADLRRLESDLDQIGSKAPDYAFELTRTKIASIIKNQRQAFRKGINEITPTAPLYLKVKRVAEWSRNCVKEGQLLNQALERARDPFIRSVEAQQQEQVLTCEIVAYGLGANVLLAYFLAVFFHKNIANRVARIVAMAKKLPDNQPISLEIGGNDELVELATELGVVGEELARLEEFRCTLVQMMAHDVRSPLMSAGISVEVLAEQTKNDCLSKEGAIALELIKKSVACCLDLVNDLLLLESIENGTTILDLDLYDVFDVAATATTKVMLTARAKKVEIANNVESMLLSLDHDRISFVLERLLVNAVARAQSDSVIEVCSAPDSAFVRISVYDSAEPLSRQKLEQLYDRFDSLGDTTYDQPGLGLALVEPIIRLHGGTCSSTTASHGNCLSITLPRIRSTITPERKR